MPPIFRFSILMLCSAAVLSACGGSGGPAPVPVPTAVADVAVANRDGNVSVPVLVNDSVTNFGRLKLVSATTPAHGTATISGDAIIYTPAAGYIGADSFSYTVKDAGEGAATSTAQVAITVNGAFGMVGRVTEALRSSASITINVGAKSFTGTAGTDGFYSVAISSANVDDMITVTARGTGEQAHLKLVSLAGDLKTAAAAAGGVQQLNPGQLPGLNVGSVSTALYALATRKNGGVVPATQQALVAASSAVGVSEVVQMAALVRMAATPAQLPLPAGASDTLALVSNAALYTQFARATLLNQAATVQQVSTGLALDPVLTVAPLVKTNAAKSLNFFSNEGCCALPTTELVLNANGTGELSEEQGRFAGTWTSESSLLRLTLAQPAVTLSFEEVQVNGQPRQVQVRREVTSYELRQISGSADQGLAVLVKNGSLSYPNGELAPARLSSSTIYQLREWASIPALAAADVGGVTYAGIVDTIIAGFTGTVQTSQVFAADGTGRRFYDGDTSWKLESGKLVTNTRNGDDVLVQTLARLRVSADGEERWLVRVGLPGGSYRVYESLMVKQQAGLAMTPALAANRWRSRAGADAIGQELHINVRADGIAEEQTFGLDDALNTIRSTTWTAGDASLGMAVWSRPDGTIGGSCPYLFGCTLIRSRGWTLLRSTGDTIFVMEQLFVNGQNLRRVNRYDRVAP